MFREGAIHNAIMVFGMPVLGMVLTVLFAYASGNPVGFAWFTILLYGFGLALFVTAKLSLYRQGLRLSWGSARMSPRHRWMYRIGYCVMGLGFLSTVALAIHTRLLLHIMSS